MTIPNRSAINLSVESVAVWHVGSGALNVEPGQIVPRKPALDSPRFFPVPAPCEGLAVPFAVALPPAEVILRVTPGERSKDVGLHYLFADFDNDLNDHNYRPALKRRNGPGM